MNYNSPMKSVNSLTESSPTSAQFLLENNNTGSISGSKWNDLNENGEWDAEEPQLAGWTIYLDANDNGELDEGEISTVTDEDGNYTFTNLPIGTYTIAEELQPNWVQTSPGGFSKEVTQLTDNEFSDSNPQISGNHVVWQGSDGNDTEIYLYNGSKVIQLTDNSVNDTLPQISGNHVVWQGSDGNDTEIYLYNGSEVIQLTDNSVNDTLPQISGNHVVWQGSDGNDTEIYLYNGSEVIQLTDNNNDDEQPKISGNNVVWHSHDQYDDIESIYFYDGNQQVSLVSTGYEQFLSAPQISGNNVVWKILESVEDSETIKLYNGSQVIRLAQTGDDQYLLSDYQVSGNNVVWNARGYDIEGIYLYDGSQVVQLTDTAYLNPQISGNNVVWQANGEIYRYDGRDIIQVTNNDVVDILPQISGNNIVWTASDGNDTEIYTFGSGNTHTVTLDPGEIVTNINFGNHQLTPESAEIHGLKWNDSNCNGSFDTGETRLSGWTIYLDTNTNGQLDAGETSTITTTDGTYSFTNLEPGTYTVAEVQQTGWEQTSPISGSHTVEVSNGEMVENLDFGNRQSIFDGTNNADNLTGTICADTLNGLKGNDTLHGLDDNDVLNGQDGKDALYGDKGNDLLRGNNGDDIVVGGEGNDRLFGGNGLDTLVGVDAENYQPGIGEIDQLNGVTGVDHFVLGDELSVYYEDGNTMTSGVSDYGWIKDFVVGEDVIQLSGSASNYFLAASPAKLPKGTAIFLETGTTDELIGIVRNVPLAQLELTSSSFSYV
jgi:beta propeller repeat protein